MLVSAKKFRAENELSPVVYGAVIGGGGEGCTYTLENNKTFSMNAAECGKLPAGFPKWKNT